VFASARAQFFRKTAKKNPSFSPPLYCAYERVYFAVNGSHCRRLAGHSYLEYMDAPVSGDVKRVRTGGPTAAERELASIHQSMLELVAQALGKDEADVGKTLGVPPSPPAKTTLLDYGVTSAAGAGLRSRVFKQLEAELTTFELLTTPFIDLCRLIADAQKRETMGAVIPPMPAGLPNGLA
jgi:hypothetical protein